MKKVKVFIVFMSVFIFSVYAISFQGDLNSYCREELVFKEITEEAAAGASLLIEEEEFSIGNIVFDYEKGKEYAAEYINHSKINSRILQKGKETFSIEFQDDKMGYDRDNTEKIPAVRVTLKCETKDMFRIPFVKVCHMERTSEYELPETVYRI